MNPNRFVPVFVSLVLLSACGDDDPTIVFVDAGDGAVDGSIVDASDAGVDSTTGAGDFGDYSRRADGCDGPAVRAQQSDMLPPAGRTDDARNDCASLSAPRGNCTHRMGRAESERSCGSRRGRKRRFSARDRKARGLQTLPPL